MHENMCLGIYKPFGFDTPGDDGALALGHRVRAEPPGLSRRLPGHDQRDTSPPSMWKVAPVTKLEASLAR